MRYLNLLSCPAVTGHERIQIHLSDAFLTQPIDGDVALQVGRVDPDVAPVTDDGKIALLNAPAHGLLACVQDTCRFLHGE